MSVNDSINTSRADWAALEVMTDEEIDYSKFTWIVLRLVRVQIPQLFCSVFLSNTIFKSQYSATSIQEYCKQNLKVFPDTQMV